MSTESVTRTVRVTSPIEGDITVTFSFDLPALLNEAARQIAFYALTNAGGKTTTIRNITLGVSATASPELLSTRNAYLRLNGLKRQQLTEVSFAPQP